MKSEHFKPYYTISGRRRYELACHCCGKEGINRAFLQILESVRSIYGRPMIINSAYRCDKHNAELPGASKTSSHMCGFAVDVKVLNNRDRYSLMAAAMCVGITRFGVAYSFLHFDADPDKPKNVIWTYSKKLANIYH